MRWLVVPWPNYNLQLMSLMFCLRIDDISCTISKNECVVTFQLGRHTLIENLER